MRFVPLTAVVVAALLAGAGPASAAAGRRHPAPPLYVTEAGASRAAKKDEVKHATAAGELKTQAEQDIAAQKAAAMQEIYQQAVTLASMLSAKTIRRQLSADDHRALLDEALAELKNGVRQA